MTIPYNISLTGVGEQLLEKFRWIKDINNQSYVEISPEFTFNNKILFLNSGLNTIWRVN